MSTAALPRIIAVAMLTLLITCVAVWWWTGDRLPKRVRIATAIEGGLYARFGHALAEAFERRTGVPVDVVKTLGSIDNAELLAKGEVDLAVIQDGTLRGSGVRVNDLSRLAPLYREVCHVLVPSGCDIEHVEDLTDATLLLGPERSGLRRSALHLLEHYEIDSSDAPVSRRYFADLPTLVKSGEVAGAVVTTGVLNPDLQALLQGGDFRLLPIRDAGAMAIHHPYFTSFTIPRGLYSSRPPVPPAAVQSVATTSFLVARKDAPSTLVSETLQSLYHSDIRDSIPTIITERDARLSSLERFHSAARRYFHPFGGLDTLSNFMESLSAFKELLFALGAAGYLVWSRWQSVRKRERLLELQTVHEHLDEFLDETVKIERAQMDTTSVDALEEYLDDVTRIKLRAIEELTHEDLRSDQRFAIFMTQCADLIRKLQAKISIYSRRGEV